MRIERREVPFDVDTDGNAIGGYAAVYDAESNPIRDPNLNGGKPFTELVEDGAFDDSLADSNVQLLVQHDPSKLVADTRSGLMRLRSDDKGLAFDVTLPDTTLAADTRALVRAGVLREMSFGFYARADRWSGSRRTLTRVDLREVSIVSAGAYSQTSAEARTLQRISAAIRLRLRTTP
jgi:HK97 family phage prohead protease